MAVETAYRPECLGNQRDFVNGSAMAVHRTIKAVVTNALYGIGVL
jgi:hypothetical protein